MVLLLQVIYFFYRSFSFVLSHEVQPQGANISFNRKQICNENVCVVLLGRLESAYLSSSLKDQIYIFSLKCLYGYQIFDTKLKFKKKQINFN